MPKIINESEGETKNMIIFGIIGIFTCGFLTINAMIGVTTSAKRIAHMVRNLEKLDKVLNLNYFKVLDLTIIDIFITVLSSPMPIAFYPTSDLSV